MEVRQMTRSTLSIGLAFVAGLALLSGCQEAGKAYGPEHLTGQWTGDAPTVHAVMGYANSSRTLTVTDQQGNLFRGTIYYKTTATAHVREATESVIGIIDPATGKVTIATDEDNGVFKGKLIDKNTLELTYVEAGPDGVLSQITLTKVNP
jgi:hypothetical protein